MTQARLVRGLLAAFVLSTGTVSLHAQGIATPPQTPGGKTIVGQPWSGSVGVKRTIAQIAAGQRTFPRRKVIRKTQEKEGPNRKGLRQNPLSPRTAPGTSLDMGPRAIRPGAPPKFTVGTNFLAATSAETQAYPPDSMGDVGPTQVLVALNGRIKLFDRNGNLGALNVDLDLFFDPVRTPNSFVSDPRVRFDRLTNRWFVVAIDVPATSADNRVLLAVSDGPTLTGASSFTFYQFTHSAPAPTGDGGMFFDYPTLGVDANALYIGGNVFSGNGFVSTTGFVVRKSSITGGGPMVVTAFRNLTDLTTVTGMYTPQGVDNDDPSATSGYFVGVDFGLYGTLVLRRVNNPGTTPTLSAQMSVTVPTTYMPLNVRPSGNTDPLDALDDRLYAAKIHTDRYTGVKSLWTAHNIGVNATGVGTELADRTASRYYEILNFDTTPTRGRTGTLFDNRASGPRNYWLPSVAMTGQGYPVMSASAASASTFAGIDYAFRYESGPQDADVYPTNIIPGVSAFNQPAAFDSSSGIYRWGDYSHTVVDPTDGQTVWTFQMYANATNSYGVRVVRLLAPAPAAISSATPSAVSSGTTIDVVVAGTSTNGTAFFDGGSTFAKRLAASVSGNGVTVQSVTLNSKTQVTVRLNVAAEALSGSRTLTITNPDGQSVSTAITVQARTLRGTVSLGNFVGTVAGEPVTITLYNPGSSTVLETLATTLDSTGGFAINSSLAAGTYDVAVKGRVWLRKRTANVAVSATGATGVNASLINGDANGDNRVLTTDYAIINAAFGSAPGGANWNKNADLDGNLKVEAADLNIAKANFRQFGAN